MVCGDETEPRECADVLFSRRSFNQAKFYIGPFAMQINTSVNCLSNQLSQQIDLYSTVHLYHLCRKAAVVTKYLDYATIVFYGTIFSFASFLATISLRFKTGSQSICKNGRSSLHGLL